MTQRPSETLRAGPSCALLAPAVFPICPVWGGWTGGVASLLPPFHQARQAQAHQALFDLGPREALTAIQDTVQRCFLQQLSYPLIPLEFRQISLGKGEDDRTPVDERARRKGLETTHTLEWHCFGQESRSRSRQTGRGTSCLASWMAPFQGRLPSLSCPRATTELFHLAILSKHWTRPGERTSQIFLVEPVSLRLNENLRCYICRHAAPPLPFINLAAQLSTALHSTS